MIVNIEFQKTEIEYITSCKNITAKRDFLFLKKARGSDINSLGLEEAGFMELKEVSPISKAEAQAYAAEVLQNHIPCTVKNISYIGGGSFGYVYKASTDKAPYRLVLKACRVPKMAEKEAMALNLLGKDSLIKIPEVYFTSIATESIPIDFICMEHMPGKNCFTDFVQLFKSKAVKKSFADKVTSALNLWHSTTNDKFGFIEDARFDEWLDFYKPFAHEVLESARKLCKEGKLENKVLAVMENAWLSFDYIFSEKVKEACLIHGDMNVMNILADKKLNPVAIIDPLDSKWADKEYELFQLRNLTGDRFGLYDMYKEKYPVSEKCDIKTAFYALYHEVYCYILSGKKFNFILMPLVKRMKKELKKI